MTLVETLISIVLVGGLLVAALNTVGASTRGSFALADHARAHLATQQLMAEIMAKDYEDLGGSPLFGREATETAPNRTDFDDVDDYRTWTSSPPKDPSGAAIAGLGGWTRSSTVDWVVPTDLTSVSSTDTGVKRVTVTANKSNQSSRILAKLVAIRTAGPPPPDNRPVVLFVVTNDQNLTAQESARVTLIDSWGYQVTLIAASEPSGQFNSAVADAAVAYVSEEIMAAELGTKLRDASIGVVNEDAELTDEFGFSSETNLVNRSLIWIIDSTHTITSGFAIDLLTIFTSSQPVYTLSGFGTPDFQALALTNTTGPNYYPSLGVIEVGGILYGGGSAAARRVQLPWGADAFDFNALNADGQTIMKRAIEWAANQ